MLEPGNIKIAGIFIALTALFACEKEAGKSEEVKAKLKCLEVRASAYNSVRWQTSNYANITAWGDTLKPGMKTIAVSRDLIDSGLVHNKKVQIEGLTGEYLVKDKMNARWRRKIDIYMGDDLESARNWGVKKVALRWKED